MEWIAPFNNERGPARELFVTCTGRTLTEGALASGAPMVSVLMPIYNHERFVAEALGSVLDQTFEDWELIAMDDGSTDSSLTIAGTVVSQNRDRMQLHTHPHGENRGLSATLEACLRRSRGQWVALLASDDRWLPNRLTSQLSAIAASGTVGAYGRCQLIDEDGRPAGSTWGQPAAIGRTFFEQLLLRNVAPALTLLLRREVLLAVGGFPDKPRYEDLHLLVRMADRGPFVFVDEVLADYRVVRGGVFQVTALERAHLRTVHATLLEVLDMDVLSPQGRCLVRRWADSWAGVCRMQDGCLAVGTDQQTAVLLREQRQEFLSDATWRTWVGAVSGRGPAARLARRLLIHSLLVSTRLAARPWAL